MLDINNFKKINDSKGHHFGDQVLVEIASIISRCFKENSTVCRYGGDEFIVVSGIYDREILNQKRIELNEAVNNSHLNDIFNFKLSIGMCICENPEVSTIDQVIILADNDMYKDKESNRKEI
jgi:diguanylate cyclase (GGDEF)-like protein